MRSPNQTYSCSYAAIFLTSPPLRRSSPTKKLSGSIGNTTLHSLPGLYLLAISNAPSMLSATNATLNLAALLLTSMAIFIIRFFFRIDPLNAWCELSLEDLSGRCPRTRVGLLTNPEGKGTDSSWLTWTPSSPHFTSWSTIFASLIEPYEADPVLMPPSVVVRSSPSLSSLGGRGSPARGTSTATPRHICEQHSLPFQTVPSSTGSCDSMLRTSRRSL